MYANCYKLEGVTKAIQILKTEITHDAAQAGIADLKNINPKAVSRKEKEKSSSGRLAQEGHIADKPIRDADQHSRPRG
jgi:hypothetical protein